LSKQSRAKARKVRAATRLPAAFRTALPAFLLITAACLAYANAWPNTLIYDDKLYLDYQRFTELSAIPRYFLEHAWAAGGVDSGLYRPMLLVSITLDANLFGDWYAGYHLVNILLHAAVTVLLYAFLARLLALDERTAGSSAYVALLAALVFAVHPVHTEVVNSVFNRSILLAALATLGGLWWLLRYLVSRPILAWAGLFLAYLLAMFCRETAIALPGMAAVLVLLYTDGELTTRIRKVLPVFALLIPMIFYLQMRSNALAVVTLDPESIETTITGVTGQLDARRLLQGEMILGAAGVWLQAFGVLLWPFYMRINYSGIPSYLQWAGILLHIGLLGLAMFRLSRGHRGLLAGLAIFYLDLLPSSHLLSTGDVGPHLSARYLYVATAGLMIAVSYALSYVQHRFDRLLAAAPVLLSLLILAPVTWARNADWADEVALFKSDYRWGNPSGHVLKRLTGAYFMKRDFPSVIEICDANRDRYGRNDTYGTFTLHCASALSYSGRLTEAERLYMAAISIESSRRMAHSNLAQHYLRQGRWDEAKIQFEKAIEAEKDPARKAYSTGYMLAHLYPRDREKLLEARAYFEEALAMQPHIRKAQSWLDRINAALETAPDSEQ
jgi:protein O-mannosyl-transferase